MRRVRVVRRKLPTVTIRSSADLARPDELAEGAVRSTLDELADWTVWAGRVVVF